MYQQAAALFSQIVERLTGKKSAPQKRGGLLDRPSRHVNVDRTRTPVQVLDATDRVQYTSPGFIDTLAPCHGKKNVEVFSLNLVAL